MDFPMINLEDESDSMENFEAALSQIAQDFMSQNSNNQLHQDETNKQVSNNNDISNMHHYYSTFPTPSPESGYNNITNCSSSIVIDCCKIEFSEWDPNSCDPFECIDLDEIVFPDLPTPVNSPTEVEKLLEDEQSDIKLFDCDDKTSSSSDNNTITFYKAEDCSPPPDEKIIIKCPPTTSSPQKPIKDITTNTPILGRPLLQRHGKRKIWDVYPEFHEDYGKKQKLRISETSTNNFESKHLLKSEPTLAPLRRISHYNSSLSSQLHNTHKITRPRIILTFRIPPPPNPIPKGLAQDVLRSRLLHSLDYIHSELLFSIGCAPQLVDDPNDYEAVSQNSLRNDLNRVRKKVNLVNRVAYKSSRSIDLDKEYDRLLRLQFPSLNGKQIKIKSNPEKILSTAPDQNESVKIMQMKDFIYLRIHDRIIHVKPAAIVIQRLSDEDIKSILSPPTGLMLSSKLNRYI